VYVGQTGRDFHTIHKEHLRAFQYNTQQSKFAQHLTKQGHTFGSINSTMEIVQLHRKGTHLNTEKFHIHKEFVDNNHLNEEYADNNNHKSSIPF
jgi:ribosomal protein L9